MKTLVVDDSYGCRCLVEAVLQQMGHQVEMAENGRDGVLMYQKAAEGGAPYDFITMDNIMPVMNGIDAARSIRAFEADHSDLKRATLCFVSSDHECHSSFMDEFQRDSLTSFIFKPMNLLCFISLVREAAER